MKLFYWQGEASNFGDDLNSWLWQRLLPHFFDDDEKVIFLAIGSVLYDSFGQDVEKVVFGTGYGGYTPPPVVDSTWKVYFVRGRLTADILGIDRSFALGDPASLIRLVLDPPSARRSTQSGVGFMPHWESARDGNWEKVANAAGLHFVDPRWPVERVLEAICQCRSLVTESLHGAIVADALRVPWIPYSPPPNHQMKWFDWAEVMQTAFVFEPSARSSILELLCTTFWYDKTMVRRLRKFGAPLKTLGSCILRNGAVKALISAKNGRMYLTSEARLDDVVGQMKSKLTLLREDYGKPRPMYRTNR